ncbi:NADH-cytochrome b5 reductase-like [Linderina pennispora]|nr:NADH-cytochrome b5 reductase-like [Linderina pennispora]
MADTESDNPAVLALYEEIARAKKRAAERKKAKEEQANAKYGSVLEGDQLVLKLPPPPLKPDADECCNSGCTPCILDTYKETMDTYASEVAVLKLNHQLALRGEVTDNAVLKHMGLQPGLLNPLKFTMVRVIAAQQLNSYSRLFIIDADSSNFFLAAGEHIHIRATVNDARLTRPFTPLMIEAPDGVVRPHLLIRLYDHGLSHYFRTLGIGDYMSVRGPVSTTGNLTKVLQGDAVLLIAGGSGIAPIFQILQFAHVNESYRSKRIVLVQCAIEHTGVWLSKEIAGFAKDMPQLTHHIFLSQDSTATASLSTGHRHVMPGRLTLGRLRKIVPEQPTDRHAIVCGPGLFNQDVKAHLEALSIANIQLL